MMDFLCLLIKPIIKLNKITSLLFLSMVIVLSFNFILMQVCYADNLKEVIEQVSESYNISSDLIYKVIETESSFNPYAISPADARGLMQITRPTWDWICRDLLNVAWSFDEDSFNSEKNIIVGTRYLAWINNYLNKHKDELNAKHNELLLACYNAGPGTVRNYGFRIPPYEETQNYISKITASYQ